jgi:hypothetical protein
MFSGSRREILAKVPVFLKVMFYKKENGGFKRRDGDGTVN